MKRWRNQRCEKCCKTNRGIELGVQESYYSILNLAGSGTWTRNSLFKDHSIPTNMPKRFLDRKSKGRVSEEIAGIDEKLKNVTKDHRWGTHRTRASAGEKIETPQLEPTRTMKFLAPGRLLKIETGTMILDELCKRLSTLGRNVENERD